MEETLYFVKETKNTFVFGNDVIQTLYLPKEAFDYEAPTKINVSIDWED